MLLSLVQKLGTAEQVVVLQTVIKKLDEIDARGRLNKDLKDFLLNTIMESEEILY